MLAELRRQRIAKTTWQAVPMDSDLVVPLESATHELLVEVEPKVGRPIGLVRHDAALLAAAAPEMARMLERYLEFLESVERNLDRLGCHAEAQTSHDQAAEVRALLARAGLPR